MTIEELKSKLIEAGASDMKATYDPAPPHILWNGERWRVNHNWPHNKTGSPYTQICNVCGKEETDYRWTWWAAEIADLKLPLGAEVTA